MLLFAAPEAGLADLVGFLVTVDDDDGDGTLEHRRWSLQLGRRSRSTLGPLVANLAACVSWGDWRPPRSDLELPMTPGTAELRAALRRGQFRRKEPAGAAAGVRVLDVGPMHSGHRGGNGEVTAGSPPAPHLRRGHWRRQRLGPHDSWHYEPRWIPPRFAAGSGTPAGTLKVYRLPVPPRA